MNNQETTKEQQRELLFPGIRKEVYKTKRVKVNTDKIYEQDRSLIPSDTKIKDKESIKRKEFIGDVVELAKFSDCLTSKKTLYVKQNIPSSSNESHSPDKLQFISKFFFKSAPVTNTLTGHLQYNQLQASEDPQKLSEEMIRPSMKDQYKMKSFLSHNLIFLIFPNKRTIYVNKISGTQNHKNTRFLKRFDFDCKIFDVHKLTPSLFLVTSENRFYILKSDLQSGFSADYKAKLNMVLPNDVRCNFKNVVQTDGFVTTFKENRLFFFQKPDLRFVQFLELRVPGLKTFKIKTVEYLNNEIILAINDINNFILVQKGDDGKFKQIKILYDDQLVNSCSSYYDSRGNIIFIGTKLGKIHIYKTTPDNNLVYLKTFFSKNMLGHKIHKICYDSASKIGIFHCIDKKNGIRQFSIEECKTGEDKVGYDIQVGVIDRLNLYIRSVDLNVDFKSCTSRIFIGTSKGFVNIYKNK